MLLFREDDKLFDSWAASCPFPREMQNNFFLENQIGEHFLNPGLKVQKEGEWVVLFASSEFRKNSSFLLVMDSQSSLIGKQVLGSEFSWFVNSTFQLSSIYLGFQDLCVLFDEIQMRKVLQNSVLSSALILNFIRTRQNLKNASVALFSQQNKPTA